MMVRTRGIVESTGQRRAGFVRTGDGSTADGDQHESKKGLEEENKARSHSRAVLAMQIPSSSNTVHPLSCTRMDAQKSQTMPQSDPLAFAGTFKINAAAWS